MSEALNLQELPEDYHSPYSPSSLAMNMRCPAAYRRNQGVNDEAGFAAEEGTAIHWLGETKLKDDSVNLDDFKGLKSPNGIDVTAEMITVAMEYVDYVNSIPGEKLIEQRVSYSDWAPGQSGTADCVVLPEWDEQRNANVLRIVDLKGGGGVQVFAEDDGELNYQLGGYALGVIQTLGFLFSKPVDLIDLTIVQPRFDHIDTYTVTLDELMTFGEKLRAAYRSSMEPSSGGNPGPKQCRWCKVKAQCPELNAQVKEQAETAFALVEGGELLPPEKLAEIKSNFDMWTSLMSAVNKQINACLAEGTEVPGYKLVLGNKNRTVPDEKALVKFLGDNLLASEDDLYVSKLLSPSQIEKLLRAAGKRALYAEEERRKEAGEPALIVKPEGEPQVAPESDARSAYIPNPAEGFKPE